MYRKLHNNKVPMDNVLHKTVTEVLPHVKAGGQIGWVIDEGYIVIDVDDKEESDILYNMLTDPKDTTKLSFRCHGTKKGKHFIFKLGKNKITQGVKKHTPVGVRVDTRTAGKGFIVMPFNDPDRSVIKDDPMEGLSVIPKWLVPLNINVTNDNFLENVKSDGDGRNDAVIRQIFRLKGALMKAEDIEKAIDKINNFWFTEPMPEQELRTCLRPEVLNLELSLKENKFSHADMADEIMERYDIRVINDENYMYDNGVYRKCTSDINRIMISMYRDIKASQRKEVLEYIKVLAEYNEDFDKDNYVNCFNGIYDMKTKQLLPHDSELATRNQVTFSYRPEMKILEVDQFLDNISDHKPERVKLILQMLGYALTRSIREQKVFFLYGSTAQNGKSTFINVMKALVGNTNYSTLSLKELSSDKFAVPELDNKLLNVYADISSEFLKELEILKNLSTGDEIMVQRKFGQPFQLKPFCKFVFSANNLPKAENDKGWHRRIMIVPFTKSFKGAEHFEESSIMHQDALDYLGTIAINAYTELYNLPQSDETKWANYQESNEYLMQYKEESDTALAFINSFTTNVRACEQKDGDVLYKKSELYNDYVDYCLEGHHKPKSKQSFGKTVKDNLSDIMFRNNHYWILTENMYYEIKSTKDVKKSGKKSLGKPKNQLKPLKKEE